MTGPDGGAPADPLAARIQALMEGLDAVGWTDGAIRAALRTAIRDALGRAANAAKRYAAANRGCARRAAAGRTIAAEILRDDRE